eukprot:3543131-Prymnesium_polylepis.1
MNASGPSARSRSCRTIPRPIRQAEGIIQFIQSSSPKKRSEAVHSNHESGKPIAYVPSSAATTCTNVSATLALDMAPISLQKCLAWCSQRRKTLAICSNIGACRSLFMCKKCRAVAKVSTTAHQAMAPEALPAHAGSPVPTLCTLVAPRRVRAEAPLTHIQYNTLGRRVHAAANAAESDT